MAGLDEKKQLTRPREGRIVVGVCAGFGEYLGIDPNVVRVVLAAITVFSAGMGIWVYLVAWVVMPEEGEPESIMSKWFRGLGGSS
ncbi:MAG TPA: PspC domain-containing protein [Streptosporangiaceae bacterium]|nr:PspC domain-containing protein [Streptosporangiaceae bacterium]